ncbi:uncharacterized protein BT62DRAFT_1071336 [Guyanagaster necrorhizus]|uniref:Uncharacterized protein n=1 Tax=Guyanagaster necrorhizus TaxID=856835 RepID=A0A9P8AY73_9AGAR|nr:uncharacterized protein BT62DRAFT_1071336 [Guyanagaster necrorhizus MCA 3950]KAG7452165.1 hypothetical protein BT62DRAFT_1071336 [Guyanagaster necrorhizus MCA 3950]
MSRKWAEAKTPLTPDRLAKIANALGVSTPVPSSSSRTPPSTSKYLIHVVPPLNLPHLNNSLSSPPPPSASGYHTHFRRGTLLPVHPTLQLQLAAIAREYALPSTAGVILYLFNDNEDAGPRISDDIWKHLWSRIWKAEFAPDTPQKLPVLTLGSPRTDQLASSTTSSSSLSIPIIAKVEFDIDLRSAPWFNPWITSRNLNYNKRVENKNSPVPLSLPQLPQSESQLEDEEEINLRLAPTMYRKNIPSPLVLGPSNTNATNSSSSLPSSATSLPYLRHQDESDEDTEIDDDSVPTSGKRGGGIYDDLELDFDESFEEDTKESQYLLTAKLDEIEKNLAQFSPRVLQLELQEDQAKSPLRTEVSIASPKQPSGTWPSVPFQSLHSVIIQPILSNNNNPSPPQLALNGVTTSAPQSFNPTSLSTASSETIRRKQMEEEESEQLVPEQYPRYTPQINGSFKDAIIPLSPDPFGRYPSTPTPSADSRGSTYWDDSSTAVDESITTSSRFSADSAKDHTLTNRATMMSVKSIKKLWRRSNKQSVSSINMPQPPPAQQGHISPQMPGPTVLSAQVTGTSPSISNGASAHRQSSSSSSRNSVGVVRPPPIRMSSSQTSSSRSSSSRPIRPSRPPSLHNFDIPGMSAPTPAMFPQHIVSLDRHRFDQESPYPNPTRRARAQLSENGKVSPTLASGKSIPTSQSGKSSPTPLPQTETQRNSVRRSILKWKNATSGGGSSARRPSVSILSVNVEPRPGIEKMPPSPRIPDEFLQHQQHSRLPSVAKSITSVAPSMTKSISSQSSRYSDDEGRGASIDDQFEIVSPKMTPGSLTYPYTTLDQRDTSQ